MLKKIVDKEFYVVGIVSRTSNEKEMAGNGIIGSQWNRFFSEGILDKIPNKTDGNILAVYTDYQSDRNGEYTFLLGSRVNDTTNIPQGMEMRKIPAGKYSIVRSAKGPLSNVVVEAWKQIWGMEDRSELDGVRSYKADYEVYDERSRDPQNAQVDIYIGIK